MKFFYSVILFTSAMSVCGPEKALTTKLSNDYDLKLAQKKKEIESRKLLGSVAKKQKKSNVRDNQQKNIKNNNSGAEKQKNIKLRDEQLRNMKSNYDLFYALTAAFAASTFVMVSLLQGVPIGCVEDHNVCTCLWI